MTGSPLRYYRFAAFPTIATLALLSLARSQNFVPAELIVKFRNSTPDSILNQIIFRKDLSAFSVKTPPSSIKTVSTFIHRKKDENSDRRGAVPREGFSADRIVRIRCEGVAASEQLMDVLAASPYVDFVQRNYIYKIDQTPNDSGYASQSNLERIGISQLWLTGLFDKPMPQIRVGVLDTGVDYVHPDLSSRISTNDGETGTDQSGMDKRSNGVDDDGNGYVDDWH